MASKKESILSFLKEKMLKLAPFAFMVPYNEAYHLRLDVYFTIKKDSREAMLNNLEFSEEDIVFYVDEVLEKNIYFSSKDNNHIIVYEKLQLNSLVSLTDFLLKKGVDIKSYRFIH